MIRPATSADAEAIAAIYNHYIEKTIITFEETPIDAQEISTRILEIQKQDLPWFVWEEAGLILGYSYAGKWKSRCSFRYSLESTVYLHHQATGRGLGSHLYRALMIAVRAKQYHALVGGIALPNTASVALHEKMGFTQVAHFKEVGRKFNQWIDVGYWELLL